MAAPKFTRFLAWDLSAQEEKDGSILTDLQLKRIQSLQCEAAEEMLNLELDLKDPGVFATRHAFLSGKVQLSQQLIDSHMDAIIQINTSLSEKE